MKKVFLLLAAAICATTSSFAVTYELNGGQHNPYGWTDKDDMLQAFLTDGGAAECTLTIADFQAMIVEGKSTDGLHSPGLCTYLTSTVVANAYANAEKWGWLETYVKSKYEGVADVLYSSGHYGAGAFFISGQSVSWPKSPSFAEYGKEENYFPAWGFNYGNPETVTEEFTLYAPYKDGYEFQGWFANADFTGEAVTKIDATTEGTLYAKWKLLPAVIYNIDGGQYNPYDWTCKDDMLQAFLTDGGAAECTLTIADFQNMKPEDSADGLHNKGLCKYITSDVAKAAYANTEKWGWLENYIKDIFTTAGKNYSVHYGAGAFFISGESLSWPTSPSFAEYGKEENYFPAWGFNYGNPSNPTEKVTLYRPFKTDWHFEGWFDNAEFNGEPITTIDETFKGTLYAKWIVWTGVELPVVEENKLVNVYTINGVCVMKNADEEAIKSLTPGFYIVGNQKRLIK